MTERKKVYEHVVIDTGKLFDVPLSDAIITLMDLRRKHPQGVLEAHTEDYSDRIDHRISWWRDETDEEMAARLAIEQWEAELAAENEKARLIRIAKVAQLEQLKKELGIR